MALDPNTQSAPPAPFVWGAGGAQLTPQALENRRALALAMLKQGSDYSPIASPWQGVARVTDALMGGYRANKLDQQEYGARQAAATSNAQLLSSLLGGAQSPSPNTSMAPSPSGSSSSPAYSDASGGTLPTVDVSHSGPNSVDPQTIYAGLKARGLNDAQAYSTLGNWKQESELNPAAVNPGEGAIGMDQWRLERADALRQFAQQSGKSPNDPNVQMDFYVNELKSHPGGQAFMAANDIPSANAALKTFIAYGSPYDKGGEGTRLANALAYQKMGFGAPDPNSPAAAATAAMAGGGLPQQAPLPTPNPTQAGMPPVAPPVQTASLDPSAGLPAPQPGPQASGAPQGAGAHGEVRLGADGKPYQYAQTTGMAGATGNSGWIPVNPAAVGAAPQPAPQVAQNGALSDAQFNSRAPVAPPVGMPVSPPDNGASAFAPGGAGVLPQSAPVPTGRDAVMQAMSGAPAAPIPPQTIPPSAPPSAPQGGAAQVAAAMGAQPGVQQMGGMGRSGIDPSQIAAISQALANPWASEGQQQLLGSVLSSRLTPHKIEMVSLGDGSTAEIDSITGQQVGTVKGVRPPVSLGYDQRLVDPATGQQIGGGPANGQLPFRFMTTEEKQAAGLPLDTPIQIGPDGKMVSNGVTVNTGTPQSQYSDEMAKGLSGPHMALENGVEAAQEQQRDIHAMQAAFQTIKANNGTTGMGETEISKLQSAINTGANLLGYDQPFDISNQEFLTKFNRQIAGAQAKAAGGARVTNFELKNYLAANPGLEMSPQGNERLLGIQNQILQRNIDVGQALRTATANAVAQGRKVNPAENEQLIRDYDAAHHITDPLTGQDLTRDVKLQDQGQANAPSAGTGRPRASNANGDTVEWDGTNWVPVK